MSDRFRPLTMEQLAGWIFGELDARDSIFGIPRSAFFVPSPEHRFRRTVHGVELDTPFGVAAGPHTQLAQNIVAAWLTGARLVELKTVQTLDELEIKRPCIDVEDEGYNIEWSQELSVRESFGEYLHAWVLIHALQRRLGWPAARPGVLFNMSVGYDLAGIRQPNVQWYLDAMADAGAYLPACVEAAAAHVPGLRDVAIPARVSDTVTLSTMHGCPPGEIERIARYLLEDRGLNTWVKCNPTLLGAEQVRGIVNDDLGYADIRIPDAAFAHDLTWAAAVPMFGRLAEVAAACGRSFGLKLSNTLEVENRRATFEHEPTMYCSGRALHAVTVNLASRLAGEFGGRLPISFAGGADAFNVADLLAAGFDTVTVCTDLLKTGGYLRLLQYTEHLDAALDAAGATSLDDFARKAPDAAGAVDLAGAARLNLARYAQQVRVDWRYRKESFRTDRSKTGRALGAFDCIAAPCVETCPVDQAVPRYLEAVARGDLVEADRVIRRDNPLPAVLGRVCDHLCEDTCVRTHLDEPVAIRQIKRFVMDTAPAGSRVTVAAERSRPGAPRVAVIGAGPAGLAAARELGRMGISVTVFEAQDRPGGMPGSAIPAYRLPQAQLDRDLAELTALGVDVRCGQPIGAAVTVGRLIGDGFGAVFVAVGAQRGRRLHLPGEESGDVLDGLAFLRAVRRGEQPSIGPRVGVIGAGDTAMDCARSARRLGASQVAVIYRRGHADMPADREEIHALHAEGIEVVERARPVGLRVDAGRLTAVECVRTEPDGARDASGRRTFVDVAGSAFEIGLDSLVVAISQDPVLDCFGDRPPRLARDGSIVVDPLTFATSIPGVYAGGDVADHGPASIVRAAADGKRVATAIAAAFERGQPVAQATSPDGRPVDVGALMVRRGRRAYRVPIRVTPPGERAGFEETVLGYTPDEARREAARCLACDEICSLCVSVCPNLALFTYQVDPLAGELASLVVTDGRLVAGPAVPVGVRQRLQVAVQADLCNECGACVTACPTAGRPWRDKPRLYLDAADFEAEASNAYRLVDASTLDARHGGETYRLALLDDAPTRLVYTTPALRAVLALDPLRVLEVASIAGEVAPPEGQRGMLEPAASMAALLLGLRSVPYLPRPTAMARGSRRDPGGTPTPAD